MDLMLLLVILIVVIFSIIIFKITKKLLKAIFRIVILIFVILAIFTFLVYYDLSTFDNQAEKKLYLLHDSNEIIDGFYTVPGLLDKKNIIGINFDINSFNKDEIVDLSIEDLAEINENENKLDDLKQIYSRIYVVDNRIFLKSNLTFSQNLQKEIDQDSKFLLLKFKEKRVEIIPESWFYKAISYSPGFMLDWFITSKKE